nr:squalene--hopene cyclase [Schlesneria paludicola]
MPSPSTSLGGKLCSAMLVTSCLIALTSSALAQAPSARFGEVVPRDVREIYDRGLQYLISSQNEAGDWKNGGEHGPGVTGLCLMVFLASGEDPNYGLYSNNVRRAIRSIISGQDGSTGYYAGQRGNSSMYNHGFSMLAIAEAYGAVDDRNLWTDADKNRRSIGQSLELAVRAAITSQKKNPLGGWRYSPDATDADTSVSGAVLVGLLAARNAGIEVPDEAIDRAVKYFTQMTSPAGQVGYTGQFGGGFDESIPRISIATLIYAVSRRKDLSQYKATLGYLTQRIENTSQDHWAEYGRYYQAQALFQGDVEAWEKWNKLLVRQLKQSQAADGSIPGQMGASVGTSMSCLALALNYRFLPIYER